MLKIQKKIVCYGSDLFGHSGRTVAARSKTHRFTTRETDFLPRGPGSSATGIGCLLKLNVVSR